MRAERDGLREQVAALDELETERDRLLMEVTERKREMVVLSNQVREADALRRQRDDLQAEVVAFGAVHAQRDALAAEVERLRANQTRSTADLRRLGEALIHLAAGDPTELLET